MSWLSWRSRFGVGCGVVVCLTCSFEMPCASALESTEIEEVIAGLSDTLDAADLE